jgi:secondary thiamine-phosphate synthase enzyme
VKQFQVHSTVKEELIDITHQVNQSLKELKCDQGVCFVYTPHTTAAITINENADPDVVRDILYGLEKIVPEKGYHHSEGNSSAHIKSSLLGCSEQVLIENGKLVLGTWQGIYFSEFDGPRKRTVYVKVC